MSPGALVAIVAWGLFCLWLIYALGRDLLNWRRERQPLPQEKLSPIREPEPFTLTPWELEQLHRAARRTAHPGDGWR